MNMLVRGLTAASVSALLLISLPAYAQQPQLAACKADAARICPGVAPGGGRILKCLKQHQNDITIGCAKELKAIKAKMGK